MIKELPGIPRRYGRVSHPGQVGRRLAFQYAFGKKRTKHINVFPSVRFFDTFCPGNSMKLYNSCLKVVGHPGYPFRAD